MLGLAADCVQHAHGAHAQHWKANSKAASKQRTSGLGSGFLGLAGSAGLFPLPSAACLSSRRFPVTTLPFFWPPAAPFACAPLAPEGPAVLSAPPYKCSRASTSSAPQMTHMQVLL